MALYGWKIDMSVAIRYIRDNLEMMQDLVLRNAGNNPHYIKFIRSVSPDYDDYTIQAAFITAPIVTLNNFSFEIIADACGSGDNYFCCIMEGAFPIGKTLDLFAIPIQSDEYCALREQAQSLGAFSEDATMTFFCKFF